ncbi:MAG: 50S ribosomal protein L11 methyltransferase [Hyphomicrobium sp.]|nr:MAG: 50S ribosomal protein L11 methyltransferase [Hyphomicrobium sp.]
MAQTKLTAVSSNRNAARTLAGALQDLIDPPPEALTMFEAGPESWRVDAYFPEEKDVDALNGALALLFGDGLPLLVAEQIPDLNWVALSQAALPPVSAGRFTIHGSHDRHRVPRGPNAILIDAGEAFGTAHHATTHGCLTAIDRLTRRTSFRNVLDLGCGSGVLAIGITRALPAARILATDIDAQSVIVAAANMKFNSASRQVRVACADGLAHPLILNRQPFDLVVANILAGPLIALSGAIARICANGGSLVLSGLLTPQAPTVVAAYTAHGFALQSHTRDTGWSTLTMKRTAFVKAKQASGARPRRGV